MKKYVCLVLFAVLSIGYFACTDDLETEKKNDFSVDDAKAWIDSQYPESVELKSSGEKVKKYELSELWGKAKREDNNKFVVVEVPLDSDQKFAFLNEDVMEFIQSGGNLQYAQSETRLLIRKNKETKEISGYFMTISGALEYLDKTDFKVDKNSYLEKEKDFSGMVLFHNLNGSFNIGWKYVDGEITHRITGQTDSGLHLKEALLEADCYNIVIYEVITTYKEYESGAIQILSVETNILDSYTECYYYGDGATGGGGDPIATYSSTSEYDCGCPKCPICGGCLGMLKGALPGDDGDPDDPGTEGTTTTTNEETYDCLDCLGHPEIYLDMNGFPCAVDVYNSFIGFDNTISTMLKNTFGSDDSIHVRFRPSSSLDYNVDGLFSGSSDITCVDGVTRGTFYIDINTVILNSSTKEYIGVTYAHEAIHALIKYYEINDPERGKELFPLFYETPELADGDHLTMGRLYVDKMKDIIMQLNPSMPEWDATCLAWNGLQNTRAYGMQKFQYDQINGNGAWEQLMSVTNTRERNGDSTANGTPCIN